MDDAIENGVSEYGLADDVMPRFDGRLSCKGLAQNEVRLQLYALAYNFGVFLQGTDLPRDLADWSLASPQTRLIKIGARVVRHARAVAFRLAEVAASGDLFNPIMAALQRLRAPPVPSHLASLSWTGVKRPSFRKKNEVQFPEMAIPLHVVDHYFSPIVECQQARDVVADCIEVVDIA